MIDSLVSMLVNFKENYFSWLDFPSISLTDVIEILIITFLMYHVLLWVKNTGAWNLFKGILIILVFVLLAAIFQMSKGIQLLYHPDPDRRSGLVFPEFRTEPHTDGDF